MHGRRLAHEVFAQLVPREEESVIPQVKGLVLVPIRTAVILSQMGGAARFLVDTELHCVEPIHMPVCLSGAAERADVVAEAAGLVVVRWQPQDRGTPRMLRMLVVVVHRAVLQVGCCRLRRQIG